MPPLDLTVWTVGHSTHSLAELLDLLRAYRIELVADVRRFPGSRKHPQYQQPALESALHAVGIDYVWLPALGGRRRAPENGVETAWRHPAFAAYAEYLKGEEFAEGLVELITPAHELRTVIMCAEALWWRCHRRMIADVLVSLGADVVHILSDRTASNHVLTPPARLLDGVLSYRP